MYANYDESIISITNSVMKEFGLENYHATLKELDDRMAAKDYKNIIIFLNDGMGKKILDDNLSKDSFLWKYYQRTLSSVFPPTTTAATTSIQNGLTPYEHNWLGWDVYVKPMDKTVTLFRNTVKHTGERIEDYNVGKTYFPFSTVVERINRETEHKAYCISPFDGIYYDIDNPDMVIDMIDDLCQQDGKKFFYVYYDNPDALLHRYGTKSPFVKQSVEQVNIRMEKLAHRLKDTLLIVTADHGHKDVTYKYIEDYPDFQNLLVRETSIEHRAVNFFVKKGQKEKFVELFNRYFGDSFKLLSRQEVFDIHLFGSGKENPEFKNSLGDYIALATADLALADNPFPYRMLSHHAGITEDEMIVPLILIDTDEV